MDHEFILTRYNGIGESPLVILIDHPDYVTGKRFNSIDDLKNSVSDSDLIYFVKYRGGDRLDEMHNWFTEKPFDFDRLNKWLIKMDEIICR